MRVLHDIVAEPEGTTALPLAPVDCPIFVSWYPYELFESCKMIGNLNLSYSDKKEPVISTYNKKVLTEILLSPSQVRDACLLSGGS